MVTLGFLALFLTGCLAQSPLVSLPLSPLVSLPLSPVVSLAGQAVAPAPSPLGEASAAGVLDPTLWGYVTAGQLWQSRSVVACEQSQPVLGICCQFARSWMPGLIWLHAGEPGTTSSTGQFPAACLSSAVSCLRIILPPSPRAH